MSDKLILKPDEVNKLDGFTIKGTKTRHGDLAGVGFQIDYKGFKISYTSDTAYFDELSDYHKGSDILITSEAGLPVRALHYAVMRRVLP